MFDLNLSQLRKGVFCEWCAEAYASGLDEDGDLECSRCAELRARETGMELDPVLRLSRLFARFGLPHPAVVAGKLGWDLEILALRVEFHGVRVVRRGTRRGKKNQPVVVDGVSLTRRQWSERTGLTIATINRRIAEGWDPERACTTPFTNREESARRGGIAAKAAAAARKAA